MILSAGSKHNLILVFQTDYRWNSGNLGEDGRLFNQGAEASTLRNISMAPSVHEISRAHKAWRSRSCIHRASPLVAFIGATENHENNGIATGIL